MSVIVGRPMKNNHYSVYVIELSNEVLKNKKFLAANPQYKSGTPTIPLYVGMTGLTPEQRFENHKKGYKACRFVKQYGIRLLPSLYASFNPMSYDEAASMEIELAEKLREEGYAVWQK